MEYNAKSKINPYIDEKIVGFGAQEKKGMSFIPKENNIYLNFPVRKSNYQPLTPVQN
jgi:hypothetical protein